MYRLAPSRWARRPKQPAKRSRNLPSRSSTARADDTDKSTGQQHTKLVQKSTVRIIGSLVRKTESDKVLLEQSERLLECLWGGRLAHVRLGGLHRRECHMAFSRRTWPLPEVETRNRERA